MRVTSALQPGVRRSQSPNTIRPSLTRRTVSVNDANIAEFALYAEYSTSVYCNYDVEAGTAITCGGECDTIESQGATVLGTFE